VGSPAGAVGVAVSTTWLTVSVTAAVVSLADGVGESVVGGDVAASVTEAMGCGVAAGGSGVGVGASGVVA
jgi:hypothetical protein